VFIGSVSLVPFISAEAEITDNASKSPAAINRQIFLHLLMQVSLPPGWNLIEFLSNPEIFKALYKTI
jgi:hypothetical protein